MPVSTNSTLALLEDKYHGFKGCLGGEELNRASASLSGSGTALKILSPKHEALSGDVFVKSSIDDSEELSPQIQELKYAAKLYSNLSSVSSYDSCYSYGLVLQELASRMVPGSHEQVEHLQQACAQYELALKERADSFAVLYNWGVALSDLARASAQSSPSSSRAYLVAASHKYATSLQVSPGNVLALNNWGLALQDLASDSQSSSQHDSLVAMAMDRFRAAVHISPEFDRAVYNMGTVLYSHACGLKEALDRAHSQGGQGREHMVARAGAEARLRSVFEAAAQYVVLAYTLMPSREVYRTSFNVVRPKLPLPYLRSGCLRAASPPESPGSAAPLGLEAWVPMWFVMDEVSLHAARGLEGELAMATTGVRFGLPPRPDSVLHDTPLCLPLASISQVERVNDPSLPEGEAFWVALEDGTSMHLIADDTLAADTWVDVLLLAVHIVKTRGTKPLTDALAVQTVKRDSYTNA